MGIHAAAAVRRRGISRLPAASASLESRFLREQPRAELAAPAWKYTLTVGKKGVSFDTKLPKKQYKTKWIIAEKA